MNGSAWLNKLLAGFILVILLTNVSFLSAIEVSDDQEAVSTKNILYINSYHEGYKWSDDIQTAIEATF